MIVSWVLFPVVLTAVCLGCGLLLEACLGRPLPGLLLAPAGFAVVTVLASVLTSRGEAAFLATPLVVAAAAVGMVLACRPRDGHGWVAPWRGRRLDGWAVAAGFGAFAVFAAPVVLSGNPTFLGYIKLDDTATWMAFIDRVMDHGRDLAGLEPSTYKRTLEVNLPAGYPIGAFLPLGVGRQPVGSDVAWLVQPYMATMAGLLALCLYELARPLIEERPLRALVAWGAAQSALLYAYSLWGGIKEVAVALAIALLAALTPLAARAGLSWRAVVPAAVATAALLTMVGAGGLAWALPILGLAAVGLWRGDGPRALALRAAPLVVLVALLAVPALFAAGVFSPTQGGLTSASELGNLIRPLPIAQFAGIWPTGDFRTPPVNGPLAYFLIGLAVAAAVVGAVGAWGRRAAGLSLYFAGATVGSVLIYLYASPWVGAKALASGSPAFLLLALAGAAWLAERVERTLGPIVLALVLLGVLWSNALGYHDVSLAPYAQLRELEEIGEEYAGQGPTLMTEYQPYGVRHFLRAADAEGASELRYRSIPLREGGEAEKGAWIDTDQVSLPALLVYRTLVLRRNPGQSRPPATYRRVRHGDYYDVWQRPAAGAAEIAEHLPLGDFYQPAAVPSCEQVTALAAAAGPSGAVVAPARAANVVASLTAGAYPADWVPTEPGSPDLVPHGPGTVRLKLDVSTTGTYDLYVQGSVRNPLSLSVDGTEVGSVGYQLNESRQFLDLGRARLRAGRHLIELTLAGQSLAPGSGGPPEPIGPLVLSPAAAEDSVLLRLPADRARRLCGRSLDWLEAIR